MSIHDISPYIRAAQARIDSWERAKPDFIISGMAPMPRVFPRTQKEAGIAHHTWEHRLKPLRPWIRDILQAVSFALAIVTVWWAWQQMFGG